MVVNVQFTDWNEIWLGMEPDPGDPGENDETARGEKYTECKTKQGLFSRHSKELDNASGKTNVRKNRVKDEEIVLKVNDHVVLKDGRRGRIAYKGPVKFAKGEWFGIVLDPGNAGKNDGSTKGTRYFKCPRGQGLFVTQRRIATRLKKPLLERHQKSNANKQTYQNAKNFPLRGENYFHDKMDRHDAEGLVKKKGMYLLRQQGRKIILSIRTTRSLVLHIEVNYDPDKKTYSYTKPRARKPSRYYDFATLIKNLNGKTPVLIGDDPYALWCIEKITLEGGSIPFDLDHVDNEFKVTNTTCSTPNGSTLIQVGESPISEIVQDGNTDALIKKIIESLPVEVTFKIDEEEEEDSEADAKRFEQEKLEDERQAERIAADKSESYRLEAKNIVDDERIAAKQAAAERHGTWHQPIPSHNFKLENNNKTCAKTNTTDYTNQIALGQDVFSVGTTYRVRIDCLYTTNYGYKEGITFGTCPSDQLRKNDDERPYNNPGRTTFVGRKIQSHLWEGALNDSEICKKGNVLIIHRDSETSWSCTIENTGFVWARYNGLNPNQDYHFVFNILWTSIQFTILSMAVDKG